MPEINYHSHIYMPLDRIREIVEQNDSGFLLSVLGPYDIVGDPREDEKGVEYDIIYKSGSEGTFTLWKEWQNPVYVTFTVIFRGKLTPEQVRLIEQQRRNQL